MTLVRLHRHAPEAHFGTRCGVCGTTDTTRLTDHVQVGTPGTPAHDDVICELCGGVLTSVAENYGQQITMQVDETPHEAGDGDITVPGARSRPGRTAP